MNNIQHMLAAFQRNNDLRMEMLEKNSLPGARTVFQLIPGLLHVNAPGLPGYVPEAQPCSGIAEYERSRFPQRDADLWPRLGMRATGQRPNGQAPIRSLFLMGSAGTVGQSSLSDLDYWVCLDRDGIDDKAIAAFHRKLAAISQWAMKTFSTEVHLYLMDCQGIRCNAFSIDSNRSEGAVAPNLLKEEFYRTFLHLAGEAPLWWGLPPGVSSQAYEGMRERIARNPYACCLDFALTDMGYPYLPPPQEYLAAALWLAQKSEDDPFKGLIKLVLLLEQVESGFQSPLFCTIIKHAVFHSRFESGPVDPYRMIITRVLQFAEEHMDKMETEMLRSAVFLKVHGPLDRQAHVRQSSRHRFLQELIEAWQWSPHQVRNLSEYASWTDQERLYLAGKMHEMLYQLYLRIFERLLRDHPGEISSDDPALAPMKARLLTRFSINKTQVENLPDQLLRRTINQKLTLLWEDENWNIFTGNADPQDPDSGGLAANRIYCCRRAARAAVWLANNGLNGPDMRLRILPRPSRVSLEGVLQLMQTINTMFPPIEAPHAQQPRREPASASEGDHLLIINFEAPWHLSNIVMADVVYRKPWGEFRHFPVRLSDTDSEPQRYLRIAEQLREAGTTDLAKIHFFIPPGYVVSRKLNNLKAALHQVIHEYRRKSGGFKAPGEPVWLDLD